MNFIPCTTKLDQMKVIRFIKTHYQDDPNYIGLAERITTHLQQPIY
ncbi:MAG: hypothetical protein LCH34_13340 [Firmicutes bacterium]|nr:hypothetical protein [Bacillota bacterium]